MLGVEAALARAEAKADFLAALSDRRAIVRDLRRVEPVLARQVLGGLLAIGCMTRASIAPLTLCSNRLGADMSRIDTLGT